MAEGADLSPGTERVRQAALYHWFISSPATPLGRPETRILLVWSDKGRGTQNDAFSKGRDVLELMRLTDD